MADSDTQLGADVHGDDGLVLALACGHSVRAAAKLAGVSESTAYRRLREPDVVARIAEIRGEFMSRATGKIAAGAVQAAGTLKRLLRSQNEAIALGAARALLGLRDSILLDERLKALEARLGQGGKS